MTTSTEYKLLTVRQNLSDQLNHHKSNRTILLKDYRKLYLRLKVCEMMLAEYRMYTKIYNVITYG